MNNLKVSVFMVTYNHENYIEEAIESVLQQKTNFDFDIVIGDDLSTDKTRAIICRYSDKFPGKFTLLFNKENIGIARNWMQTILACKGEYIAMLEGDDYWTDPDKLQQQVKFLDQEPAYSMCFHNAKVIYDKVTDPKPPHLMTENTISDYSLNSITQGWNIHTATVMFRNGLIKSFPDWFTECVFLDLPLFALLAQKGKVRFLDMVMSVYRKNPGSQVLSKDYEKINLELVKMHQLLNKHLNFEYNRNLSVKIADDYYSIALNKYKDGELRRAGRYLGKAVKKQVLAGKAPKKYNLYLAFKICSSFLGSFLKSHKK